MPLDTHSEFWFFLPKKKKRNKKWFIMNSFYGGGGGAAATTTVQLNWVNAPRACAFIQIDQKRGAISHYNKIIFLPMWPHTLLHHWLLYIYIIIHSFSYGSCDGREIRARGQSKFHNIYFRCAFSSSSLLILLWRKSNTMGIYTGAMKSREWFFC